ncbi:energy-coupling factor ABC transporter permease [Paracoccus lutimaris]|uniref:Cobalt uptake protein with substrate-specific transmembrane region n=1 Tax=Paracoccus lutimaris TaxID=1490030 RepID=A0A368YLD2_9RHOB|nr:energy-coupling factor ABC transporter permease [Paracoccus lutimaris]RCW81042.1 cobalt uptake protein with substrate-specific transmembrane region [Paracoccus lutimaris]
MHIEPGIVTGAKIALSYVTAAGAGVYAAKLAWQSLRQGGLPSLAGRSVLTTALAFSFFQILPHFPVGVSEVHFILGSTLFLLFGAAPAAIGLALALALQGLFFAPFDLPQYGMNMTTLLVPLFALQALARRIIAPGTAYVDLSYGQAFALSTAYQGGVVVWVAFWAIYGQGLAGIGGIATFGAAYMLVVLIEPLVDLAVLAGAKSLRGLKDSGLVTSRLFA